jgi:hypothetical protein
MIPFGLRTQIVTGAVLLVVLTAGAAVAKARWEVRSLERNLREAEHERDSVALEAAAKDLELDGWEVQFAQMVGSGTALLQERDSALAALATRLDDAHARIRQYVRAEAIAESTVAGQAEAQDTTTEIPRWWTGRVDDGLLAGSWRFERVPSPELSLGYSVTVPIELVSSEGGDGRWLVTGRSTDPRVTLSLDEVIVEPAEPEVVEVTSWKRDALMVVGGGVISWVVHALTRR